MAIIKQTPDTGTSTTEPPKVVHLAGSLPKSNYEEKDKRIWISGILQSVVMSPSLVPYVTRLEDFAPIVERETRKLLEAHKNITRDY